jgi:hypothetical protein
MSNMSTVNEKKTFILIMNRAQLHHEFPLFFVIIKHKINRKISILLSVYDTFGQLIRSTFLHQQFHNFS